MNDLFRKEVMEARRTSWLGGISLAQPARGWMLTAAAVLASFAVALFLTFATYTRRSRVVGHLVPSEGLATVLAPATGVVVRVDVPEGGKVAAGQMLVVVSVPRATLASGDTMAALELRLQRRKKGLQSAQSAQENVLSAQTSGVAAQLTSARREFTQINAEIATRQAQVVIAKDSLKRLLQLQRARYVSTLQAQQQEAATLEQISAVQVLQRQAIGARRVIAQLQQVLHEAPGQRQVAEAGFQRDLALLDQEQLETESRGAFAVTAPLGGMVATQMVKPGQAVQVGQPLLSLLPGDGRLEAELLVPSRSVGFIEPGDKVLLRYQAYPYQKFGHQQGLVVRVSRSAINTGDWSGNANGGEPLYRVTVALGNQVVMAFGRPELLKPGMLLDADVLGERRRLIEWILEPLYSLNGIIGQ